MIVIGDLHLSDRLGKGGLSAYVKDHDAAVAKLVNQPLSYAKKHGIRDIVLAGDLCENPRLSYEGQLALLSILRKPFTFHIILGNHDLFAEDPIAGHSLQIIKEFKLPNVHIYEKPTRVEIDGAPYKFMPWPHQDFDYECMNIAHVDVYGAKSDSGRLFDDQKLSASKAHAVIGHIHTAQKIRNTYYVGTLYQTNFGESAKKYFAHISHEDGWQVDLIRVAPHYRLHSVEVSSKADLKSIPASAQDLVKLILLPDNDLVAVDYAHLNVVKTTAVTNQKELEFARIEDIGSEVKISTNEFFKEWLRNQPVALDLKKQAYLLRREILSR